MALSSPALPSLSYASSLRRELGERNRAYAARLGLATYESYGDAKVVCYAPSDDGTHGNFLPETYRAILKNDNWRHRLQKIHSSQRYSLPKTDRRWRELDSSNSSDALLMNIFCFPETLRRTPVVRLLGVESAELRFGIRVRVPFADGRLDRTEVDMQLGSLLVEAKLTENDFQNKAAEVVEQYRDFADVFDRRMLPRKLGAYACYQLIRNVLAAQAKDASFCVMLDARRPDLMESWYAVMRSVRPADLRVRCKVLTWQELAEVLPSKLRSFLHEKYGIVATGPAMSQA
jgi:hypothetical protein